MSNQKWTAVAAATFALGLAAGGYFTPIVSAAVADKIAGEAPTKVLIDNDKVRVSLVSFPQGFVREGGQKRALDQVIVWLDEGDYTVPPRPGAQSNPNANAGAAASRGAESAIAPDGSVVRGKHPMGTVVWHPKDSSTPEMHINKAFRSIYIELKK